MKRIWLITIAVTIAFISALKLSLQFAAPAFVFLLLFCIILNSLPILWYYKYRAKIKYRKDVWHQLRRTLSPKNVILLSLAVFLAPLLALLISNSLHLSKFALSALPLSLFVGSLYYLVLFSTNNDVETSGRQ